MMLNSNDEFETHMSTLQKKEAYDWWNNPENAWNFAMILNYKSTDQSIHYRKT